MVIVLAVIRYEALRNTKEYIFVLGLSLSDALNLLAYMFAAMYRIGLLLDQSHESQANIWLCVTRMQNLLWAIATPLSSMMLAVISLDRCLCVSYPLSYIGWTSFYARSLVGAAYLFNLFPLVFILFNTNGSGQHVKATCLLTSVLRTSAPAWFTWYWLSCAQLYAAGSIALYVLVAVLYKRLR